MILLDTNVVIDMLNNENDRNWEIFKGEDSLICGIVIAELYRGVRNSKEKNAVDLFVNSVDSISVNENEWKEIGLFISKLNEKGITVPFQDAVISYIAIKNNCVLLTRDKHFKLIKMSDNRLNLFSE